MRAERKKKLAEKLCYIAAQAKTQGVEIIKPRDIHFEHPLSYLPLAYDVSNPLDLIGPLDVVFPLLLQLRDYAHFVYLIPISGGARIVMGAMQPSIEQIEKCVKGEEIEHWETFNFFAELSDNILGLLPEMPYRSTRPT